MDFDNPKSTVIPPSLMVLLTDEAMDGGKFATFTNHTGSNPVLNLDESINKLSSEMTTLHARLEHLEQERLQDVTTTHRIESSLPTKNVYCPAESEESNHVQSTWPGSRPTHPSY